MHLQWFDRYWDAISNQKCAMSHSGGVCLSADFARIFCRWVRIMWKKTCFLVRCGAYAFEKLAKVHCVPRLTNGTSTLTTQSTYERLPVASRRTRGPSTISQMGPLSVERDEVITMIVAIAPHVRGARTMPSSSCRVS